MTNAITQPRTGARDSGDATPRPRSRPHAVADKPGFARPEQARIDSSIPGGIGPASGNATGVSNASSTPQAPEFEDDSAQGLAMFVIFTSAVLLVTGAVALLALVGSWWMLGVAFAIHAAMTAVVMLTLLHVMAGPKRAIRVGNRLLPTPTGGSERRADLVGAPVVRDTPVAATEPQKVPGRHRVLVVTDENLAEANEVPEPIRPLVDQAGDIYVLAPTLTTRLQSLTGDIDRARRAADERLRTVFDHMRADGLVPRGAVGDEDQVIAIADALADFDADLMLLRLHAPGSMNENWREHGLAGRIRSHFDMPTITFFFDDQGHVVGPEHCVMAPLSG